MTPGSTAASSSLPAPARLSSGPAPAIAAALALLAIAIGATTLQLRSDLQVQLLERETVRIASNIANSKAALADIPSPTEAEPDPFAILVELRTDRSDVDRAFVYLDPDGLPRDSNGEPVNRTLSRDEKSRLASGGSLASLIPPELTNSPASPAELKLEIITPVRFGHETNIFGFHLNAGWMAGDLKKIDLRLAQQALSVFTLAGAALASVLFAAFKRLQIANRALSERSQQLLRANQELILASKTASVGAVASHLIHGLKNPLAALQQLALSQASAHPSGDSDQWSDAAGATQRMKAMIDDVIRVLRDEQRDTRFTLTAQDLCDSLQSRLANAANSAQVRLEFHAHTNAELDNRTANLVLLILENLATNALQISPPHSAIQIHATNSNPPATSVCFRVRDQGPGIPEERQSQLFVPTQSQKSGGSGLGLALSSQLARHIHATLELESSSPTGSTFRLTVPLANAVPSLPPLAAST